MDPLLACWSFRIAKFFDRSRLARPLQFLLVLKMKQPHWPFPPHGTALLELLALHEWLWTKRRHPKHIGRPACHCRLNPRHHCLNTVLLTQVKKRPTSLGQGLQRHNMLKFHSFISDAGRDTGRLGWTVGWTGQIRLLCWKVCRCADYNLCITSGPLMWSV